VLLADATALEAHLTIGADMTVFSIYDSKNGASELVPQVERGDATPARDGDPAAHDETVATHADAIEAFKRKHGVARLVDFVADDFDAPLPEDFLTISGV
jgi:hypothetical protein